MQKYIVYYEQEFEARDSVALLEADSADEAKKAVEDSIPPGMGTSIRVLNVFEAEGQPVAEPPALLAVVTNPE